ncbi:MAG: quinoprotein dehydrogenase-associated SoxYZ-like carrier [Methylococcaceae bacterium]|nr:quinoprotein dehydrogenase-associated SoxYZ-like carrier [Methylococcaceae bacterium]
MKIIIDTKILGLLIGGLLCSALAMAAGEDETAWSQVLKPKYFGNRPIEENTNLIELTAPYRAEDPALVPVSITAKIPQTAEKYIKTITLIIDNNPTPFAAAFHFTPDSGKADLALRLRFNTYTPIRAIAETNDGKLSMTKVDVKASGGCSAPIGADLDAAMARLGKMKFKLENDKISPHQPNLAQLLVSHPNITGMQMDQISRMIKPAHFVDSVKISFNGKPIMSAQTDIAVSADPNFRFYFVPDKAGELKAEIKDNLGKEFSYVQTVTP